MAQQNISVTVDDDRAMVVLSGEHEAYTADKLAGRFAGLLDEGVSIVVDLRTTTFVDSTVIGVLLAASRKAQRHGLGFVLLVGDETGWPVQRVLEVTGLVREFDVVHG
jgi:anti-anti-sigma factor